MNILPALAKDAYKIGHINQYPEGTTLVYSNFTARSGKHSNTPSDTGGVIFFGLQAFILDYLIHDWNKGFFMVPKELAIGPYQKIVNSILGVDFDVSHMEALHDLGYLPLEIKALPEGTLVPYNVPMLTVQNTHPDFYWVTNMIETVMSSELWLTTTSATTYFAYRRIFEKYAKLTGADPSFIPFQGHDFSFRGMGGRQAAAMSGLGHLAAGSCGTDTIPAILAAQSYYGADVSKDIIGVSVNATEHSVMCAGSKDGEFETFKRLITEIYPDGIVSIVSDTWDLWKVLTDYMPRLRDEILARDGKVVIRPDSGDPEKILCGDPDAEHGSPAWYGVVELLAQTFPTTENAAGYIELNPHIGAIYGDSITLSRAKAILERLMTNGFASNSVVLGIGSYTYQYVTRDTHGMAMKATYVEVNGEPREIFKDPVTDDGGKRSARGLLRVDADERGKLYLENQVTRDLERTGMLRTVFRDGILIDRTCLGDVRNLVASQV